MPKKETIRNLFDDIASGYDRFNHISSFQADKRWRRKAVNSIVDTDAPLAILDVATGTADFAIDIASRAAKGSRITGIDLSQKMLDIGKEKVLKTYFDIKLKQGDAENLEFQDCSFDRVSVAFGVRNFENLEKGLSEMMRVLKPGGKLVILELSYPEKRFIRRFYELYAFRILPIIGKRLTGNEQAFRYLPESTLKFPLPALFIPMLKQTGFSTVTHRQFMFGTCRMYTATK
ncbi:MAG: bifunctional demethylmenaquinone methyltransferase/2-methoxy-6-polyprenyl-1,4-benzoquinol methylase UbiE [Bacteroidaceae bacterium]|nr:bifunctional demethylmenaquinone methyltransferase/2-methoxy-6-polyprenyl-1,4-benzoquinol methylase UbiE [Bacteroidaceae bacterium]